MQRALLSELCLAIDAHNRTWFNETLAQIASCGKAHKVLNSHLPISKKKPVRNFNAVPPKTLVEHVLHAMEADEAIVASHEQQLVLYDMLACLMDNGIVVGHDKAIKFLGHAATMGHEAVVRHILDAELAGVDEQVTENGFARQRALVRAAGSGRVAMVRLLHERGAVLDCLCSADSEECSRGALGSAAMCGRRETVGVLLELGARVDGCPRNVYTPLLDAIMQRNSEIAAMLIEAGADVNARAQRRSSLDATALMAAVERRCYAIVPVLCASPGINLELCDHKGRTALAVAVRYRRVGPVRQLLDAGACPFLRKLIKHGTPAISKLLISARIRWRMFSLILGTRVGDSSGAPNSVGRLASHALFDRNIFGLVAQCLSDVKVGFVG